MRQVAITGMGIISPLGNDIPSFWAALCAGECGIGPITRFDTEKFKVKLAAEVKYFDPLQYMEKADLIHRDLYTQYALAAAAQAMEDSGILGKVAPERLAVYFSSGVGGMGTFQTEVGKLLEKGPKRVSPYFVPMMIANMAAAEIAIQYQARGACIPVVTACATGSNSIGEALRAIRHGYADAVICGGAEAPIMEISVAGFANMMALSQSEDPNAASLPFDARRGGFVMGEGAGCLVLEELEGAKARGAHIYGILAGYGSSCDAHHITAPQPEAEGAIRAIRQAIGEAGGCEGKQIYINAHGTGTPLNDAAETRAIKGALGRAVEHCLLSSSKSMTGHMLGAAGAAEAIVTALALERGIIPPTINLEQPDPECDLDYTPLHSRAAKPGLGLSLSLGFGGHNACLAILKAGEK
ncbi:MAG: beta-ketoacyl-ACP synthase II [Bacillota bacterium]|nr:beta-ketoacyl-ACP synthase II [Bacillota bacterium]